MTRPGQVDTEHLNPEFYSLVQKMLADAPGGGMGIMSGYRSPEHQQILWDRRLKQVGGNVARARHIVAPPGHSNHQHGIAADLSFGNAAQRQWVRDNVGKYGLQLRMSHEGWHVEPKGAKGDDKDFYNKEATPMATGNNPYEVIARRAAEKYGVPYGLVDRMIHKESSGDPTAVSKKGAAGLMQLMPGTAKDLGVTDPFDPEQNIDAGVRYLKAQYNTQGDWRRALAAYNYGPGNFEKSGMPGIPKETQDYIDKILPRGADPEKLAALGVTPMLPAGQKTLPVGQRPAPVPLDTPAQIPAGMQESSSVATPVVREGPQLPQMPQQRKLTAEEIEVIKKRQRMQSIGANIDLISKMKGMIRKPPGYGPSDLMFSQMRPTDTGAQNVAAGGMQMMSPMMQMLMQVRDQIPYQNFM